MVKIYCQYCKSVVSNSLAMSCVLGDCIFYFESVMLLSNMFPRVVKLSTNTSRPSTIDGGC